MPRPFSILPRPHSRLVALATVVFSLGVVQKAQAQFDTVYWRGGNADNWDSFGNWLRSDGSPVNPEWKVTNAIFGYAAGGQSRFDNNSYVFNDIQYDLNLKGMGFRNQSWVVDGKSLRMINSASFIEVDSSSPSVEIGINIKLDTFVVMPTLSLDVAEGSLLTITGEVSGDGPIYKADFGTAVLKGVHTYNMGTNVMAGRLIDEHPFGNYYTNADLEFRTATDQNYFWTINGPGAFTKSGAGTLSLTGDTSYTGKTTVNEGRLVIQTPWFSTTYETNADLEFRTTGSQKFSGTIGGSGSFTKSGTGTITFAVANTYLGKTTVDAGTLNGAYSYFIPTSTALIVNANGTFSLAQNQVQKVASLAGGGKVTLAAGSTFTVDGTANTKFTGVISGVGQLVKNGTGTLTLTAFNSYSNGTVVGDGRLIDYNPHSNYEVKGGAVLELFANENQTYAGAISGAGQLAKTGNGALTLTGSVNHTNGTVVSGGRLIDLNPSGNYLIDIGTLEFQTDTNQNFTGLVSGDGQLVKSGGANLTLAKPHTHGNGTVVNGGRLIDLNPLGNYAINAGVLEFQTAGNTTFSGLISGIGQLAKSGNGTLTLAGIHTQGNGTAVLGGRLIDQNPFGNYGLSNGSILEFASVSKEDFSGQISGTGSFVKSGDLKLNLKSQNTYDGATTVSAGELHLGVDNALPTSTGLAMKGGTVYLDDHNQTVGALSGNSGIDLGRGTLTANSPLNTTYSSVITGRGAFVKGGAGVLTLSGKNDYRGGTTVTGGRLIDANPHGNYAITGGALEFRTAANVNYSDIVSGAGSLTKSGAGTLTMSGKNTYSGGTTVNEGRLIDLNPHGDYITKSVLEFSNGSTATYGGIVEGTGSFIKSGAGTLTLTGSIKQGVNATIAAGTLKGPGQYLYTDVTSTGGTLEFDSTSTGSYSGQYSGTGALVKSGSQSFAMAKAPSNTGGVQVSGGTLEVRGAGSFRGGLSTGTGTMFTNNSSGTVTIGGRSVLQGEVRTRNGSKTAFTGFVSGAANFTDKGTVEFDGGYAPGNSPASVTFNGNMTLGVSNVLTMELGGTALGTGYDHLNVLGTATLGGSLNLAYINGFSATLGQSFDLFDFHSSNGTFSSIALPTLGRGLMWDTSALYTNGAISVQAVPEPASLAALGVGVLAFLRRRRKA